MKVPVLMEPLKARWYGRILADSFGSRPSGARTGHPRSLQDARSRELKPGHRPFGIVKFIVLLFLFLYGASLSAQTLEIKLVDGRSGRPIVGASSYVNVWVGTERKEAIAIPTDRNGVARLQLTVNASEVNIPNYSNGRGSIVVEHPIANYNEFFRINTPYVLCGSGGSNYSWLRLEQFSTTEILQHGYVSPNSCGKVTLPQQPGQVILFVRPLTWWEKLKQ